MSYEREWEEDWEEAYAIQKIADLARYPYTLRISAWENYVGAALCFGSLRLSVLDESWERVEVRLGEAYRQCVTVVKFYAADMNVAEYLKEQHRTNSEKQVPTAPIVSAIPENDDVQF